MIQGSATMNIPALAMVFFVFTPLLGFSRLFLAIIGAIIIGPIVVWSMRKKTDGSAQSSIELEDQTYEPRVTTWGTALAEGLRDWCSTSLGYLFRMGPIMVVAAFASGFVLQWISPETVSQYLGNDLSAVAIAATFGILINVPLLFEIPLVALLLMMGMGTAPAATLLFTAAAGGPITFWGLAKVMPKRAIGVFAGSTWVLGAAGGVAVLGLGTVLWDDVGTADSNLSRDDIIARGVQPVTFVDVTPEAGRDFNAGTGAAVGDYNGDGALDIYVTNRSGANALYRNNGDGTFTDVAKKAGVGDPEAVGNGAAWGDYDNDGDLDLFVASFGSSKLFRNEGAGSFVDVTDLAGVDDPDDRYRSTGVTWGDYDRDGHLDLLVVRHVDPEMVGYLVDRPGYFGDMTDLKDFTTAVRPLALYRNNGSGRFTDRTALLGDVHAFPSNIKGAGFKPTFVDYDNDGDADIYVVNDFGRENYPNVLWRNDGSDGTGGWRFTDVSRASGADAAIFGMGLALGDYNNDGHLDMYMTDIGDSRFLENQGDGTFADVTERTGTGRGKLTGKSFVASWGWGAAFADLDNDGLLDLYYVAGQNDIGLWRDDSALHQPNAVFMNAGDGSFVDVSHLSGADDSAIGREVDYADFNNDGLLDLFVTNLRFPGIPAQSRLFENTTLSANHWLSIATVGRTSNRDGMGARITVTADGVTQIREVGASQGHMSHSVVPVHFGLGPATQADLLEVRWPSGVVQRLTDVPANRLITVNEP